MDISNQPSSSDRGLRAITIVDFPFAFILLLIHGISTTKVVPVLGTVPMAISAIVGIVVYKNIFRSGWLLTMLDFFLALFFLGVLIPSWIVLASTYWDSALLMLGTYGTMPMMFNFAIHTFFAAREVFSHFLTPLRCPHCHNEINPSSSNRGISIGGRNRVSFFSGGMGHSRSSKEIYQHLAPSVYDDDARESSEIETTPRPSAETLRSSAAGSSRSVENLV